MCGGVLSPSRTGRLGCRDLMPGRASISVIVPTRDRPALLQDALRSVASQTTLPLEVRIADTSEKPVRDVSTPAGLDVVWCDARGCRSGAARNRAARAARGALLAFLDDDDRWQPDHLAGLVAAFDDPAVAIAYRDAVVLREHIDAAGARCVVARRLLARDWDAEMMRSNDYIAPSAVAIRSERFAALGGFDERFAFSEDWDFVLRAAVATTPVRVPGATVEVRLRDHGNASANFGATRRACLALLAQRHRLPALEPRTFWEVAEVVARNEAGT